MTNVWRNSTAVSPWGSAYFQHLYVGKGETCLAALRSAQQQMGSAGSASMRYHAKGHGQGQQGNRSNAFLWSGPRRDDRRCHAARSLGGQCRQEILRHSSCALRSRAGAEPFSVRTILGAPSLCAGSPGLGIKHGLETSCLCEDGEGEVLMASWLKWFTALRGTTTGRVRQGVSDFLD